MHFISFHFIIVFMDRILNEEEMRKQHYEKMTLTPVSSLVTKLAIPTMISMLTSSIYNMADTYFVSQLGTSAAGAVGIVFSIMAIIQAIGFTIGQGAGVNVSRLLGERKQDKAIEYASTALFSGLAFGLILSLFGFIFLSPLVRLLGATETIAPYAISYASYIFLGCPFMVASFIMNNLLRLEGKASYAMIGITTGGVLNIALDPIFIFVLELGTAGAALATSLSQMISFIILLTVFLRGKSNVSFHFKAISRRWSVYSSIFKAGLPSLSRQGLASIASVALNVNAAAFGDAAVAAMSIASRITFLLFSLLLGFGQGFQPVASFNWGAKRYDRVRAALSFTTFVGFIMMAILSIICFIFAKEIVTLFRKDDLDVIAIGTVALRAQSIILPLTAITTGINMALQSTLHSAKATFLAMLRQGICFIPAIIILPRILGLTGVEISQALSDLITSIVSLFFFIGFLKELKEKVNKE